MPRDREPPLGPPRRRTHATFTDAIVVLPRQFNGLEVRRSGGEAPHPQRPARVNHRQIQILIALVIAGAHRHVALRRRRTQRLHDELQRAILGQTRRGRRRRGDNRNRHGRLSVTPASPVPPQPHRARTHRSSRQRRGPGLGGGERVTGDRVEGGRVTGDGQHASPLRPRTALHPTDHTRAPAHPRPVLAEAREANRADLTRSRPVPRLLRDVIVQGQVVHALDVQRTAVGVAAPEHEELVRSAWSRRQRQPRGTPPRAPRPGPGVLREEEPTDARDDVHVAAERRESERGSVGGPRGARHPPVRVTLLILGRSLGRGRRGCLERAEEPLEVVLVPERSYGAAGGDGDLGAPRGRDEQRSHRVVAPAHTSHRGLDRRPDRAVDAHRSLTRELDRAFAER